MMQLVDREHCTGCMACRASCLKDAIRIEQTEFGDQYPIIDYNKCVECGKCRQACPMINQQHGRFPEKAYAVWSLDRESRKASTSGGAAAELYYQALADGGYICGAQYDRNLKVVHTVRSDMASIAQYRQSKYVYSDFEATYYPIKELLGKGETVVCISLPCKIAALQSYLGRPYDNLITVDIVCHGTPSAKQLLDHINYVAGSLDGQHIRFREDNRYLLAVERNGKAVYKKIGRTDTYLAAFLEGLNYRPSCYQCPYAKSERISDITIGDFWGLGQEIPFDHPYTGSISAVLINTDKGARFFEKAQGRLFTEERPVSEAIKGNAQLNAPTPVHPLREQFETLCSEIGFEKAVNRCLKKEIANEKKSIRKNALRDGLRGVAGVFIKKYRG